MNTNTNLNNTIASATTTAANNLLVDITTWKETALNLSRVLSEQTEIVDLLNKKLVELANRNEELVKENAILHSRFEAQFQSGFEDMIKISKNIKKVETDEEVVTKITFVDNRKFNNETLYIKGEVKLNDLTKEMQNTFGRHCTNHLGETDLVLQTSIIEMNDFDDDRIEVEIIDKDDTEILHGGENTIAQFINVYNKFMN